MLMDSQPNRSILRGVNEASNTLSAGVCGESSAATGLTIGVFGLNSSASGIAVYGLASSKRGVNYAVRGETESGEGYAGFFDGRVQIQGGTDAEIAELRARLEAVERRPSPGNTESPAPDGLVH